MFLKQLAIELAIKEDLIFDLNKRLIKGADYTNELAENGYKRYRYTKQGIKKIKKILSHLTSLTDLVNDTGLYLGYNVLKYRKEPNIWILYGFIQCLSDKGYGNAEIGFIIGRDRTTISTSKDRFPTEKNIIPYLVSQRACNELNEKLVLENS